MNCPNCNTSLDMDAEICFACGQEITEEIKQKSKGNRDKEFDELIQNLMMAEAITQDEEDPETKMLLWKEKEQKKEEAIQRYQYVSYIGAVVILLFGVSLFFSWYTIRGTVAYHGYFYTEKTANNLYESVKAYSADKLIDQAEKVAAFSPNSFLVYAQEYESNSDIQGLLAKLQIYYAKSLYLIYFLMIACLLVLCLDKKGKWSELIRISSILAAVFVLVNTLAMKLPYINLIVLNAKRVLSAKGVATRVVSEGLYLYESTKQNLTYRTGLNFAWVMAVVLVALWFVLATVLMEMSRSLREAQN